MEQQPRSFENKETEERDNQQETVYNNLKEKGDVKYEGGYREVAIASVTNDGHQYTELLDAHPVSQEIQKLNEVAIENVRSVGLLPLPNDRFSIEFDENTANPTVKYEKVIEIDDKSYLIKDDGNPLATGHLPMTDVITAKMLGEVTFEKINEMKSKLNEKGLRFLTHDEVYSVVETFARENLSKQKISRTAYDVLTKGAMSGSSYLFDGDVKSLSPLVVIHPTDPEIIMEGNGYTVSQRGEVVRKASQQTSNLFITRL